MSTPLRANDFRAPCPGPEDEQTLERLPVELGTILRKANGWLWLRGGFHVRGACRGLEAHSLERVWTGDLALSVLFPAVRPEDVPFAQDAFGDQYLLRGGEVVLLRAESGELESMGVGLRDFLSRVHREGDSFLGLSRFLETCDAEGDLPLGLLVSVAPPFVMQSDEYSLRRIDATERLRYLAGLAKQIAAVPNGGFVEIVVK